MTSASRTWLPLAAIGLSVVLWSTAYVTSSFVLGGSSPAVVSVLRFAIALVVLVPLAAVRRGLWTAIRDPRTVLLGLTGVTLYYSFANIGLLFTTPGTAALTAALLPALTAVAGVVILRERVRGRVLVGLILATVGVALVAVAELRLDLGVMLNVVGLTSYAIYTALLRKDAGTPNTPDALALATATSLWGTVLMLPWLALELITGTARLPASGPEWIAILYLGLIVSAPTMVLFNYGAERLPAAISGVATAGIPAVGYLFAVLLGEPATVLKNIGGLIAVAGIIIATVRVGANRTDPPGELVSHPRFVKTTGSST